MGSGVNSSSNDDIRRYPSRSSRKPTLSSFSSATSPCSASNLRSSRCRSGSPTFAHGLLFKTLNSAFVPAHALVAADDLLVGLFDNPLEGLKVRTMGKSQSSGAGRRSSGRNFIASTKAMPMNEDKVMFNTRFDSLFRRRVGPGASGMEEVAAARFLNYVREHYGESVPLGQVHDEAFVNLAIRYAHLRYSKAVQVGSIILNNVLQLCVRAKTFIPRGTVLHELGGLMSADEVKVFNHPVRKRNSGASSSRNATKKSSRARKDEHWAPNFEAFSVIWRASGQTGPGPDKDRLLTGPIRFVNHSCEPNSMLLAFPQTSAWGIKTLKDIFPDEEITVQYSDSYFPPGECECLACRPPVSLASVLSSTTARTNNSVTPATSVRSDSSRASSLADDDIFHEKSCSGIGRGAKRPRGCLENEDSATTSPAGQNLGTRQPRKRARTLRSIGE